MPSEYFGVSMGAFTGRCTACGAGPHNDYEHDKNCLLNISKHTPELIEAWKMGNKRTESSREPLTLNLDQMIAYRMGAKCPPPQSSVN